VIRLSFLGAAGTVTGSRYLVEAHDTRILIDAGLFQGMKQLRLRNWAEFLLPPARIDAAILTHAHVDHSGFLPRLVRQGFAGPAFVTPPTRPLLRVVLPDAAHLQEEEARYANKVGSSKHDPALPLFTVTDANQAMEIVRPIPFGERFTLRPGIEFRFHRQGHILGAAAVELTIKVAGGSRTTLYFSGDVGRWAVPILKPPEPYPGSDILIVESTYGDRLHDATDPAEQLADVINETAQRGGLVLVPAFAIDRTQELLYYLRDLAEDDAIPPLPIFLDSPMAREATFAYRSSVLEHDAEMRTLSRQGIDPLAPPNLTVTGRVDESKRLNELHEPAIIISGSGMATGGRVLHHLRHRLPHPENTILFVGYQAEGTRGRRIADGEPEVKIFGEMVPVRARVASITSLSAHADADELTIWAAEAERAPATVYVTHGEPAASDSLAQRFATRFGWNCVVPKLEETVTL
jgi:metallo-beta-lactamase family protein